MMGWTPRPTASMCQSGGAEHHLREASVSEVSIIGLDISKHVFHAHGVDGCGRAMFSKRISRGKLLDFLNFPRARSYRGGHPPLDSDWPSVPPPMRSESDPSGRRGGDALLHMVR